MSKYSFKKILKSINRSGRKSRPKMPPPEFLKENLQLVLRLAGPEDIAKLAKTGSILKMAESNQILRVALYGFPHIRRLMRTHEAPLVEDRLAQTKRRTKRRLEESPEKMQAVANVLKTMPKASKTEQSTEIAHKAKISPSTANRWRKAFDGLPTEAQNLYKAH